MKELEAAKTEIAADAQELIEGTAPTHFGRLYGISAPIGSLLGPTYDGRWLIIVGYNDGAALIGHAEKDQLAAAVARAREGEFWSVAEFQTLRHHRDRAIAEQNARMRTLKNG